MIFVNDPSVAQKDEAEGLNARTVELYRALKIFGGDTTRAARACDFERKCTPVPNHPDVARSLNNLAQHYDKPRPLRATPSRSTSASLAIARRRSVPIIPMWRQSLNNLAVLYDNQGRYAEAEPLYKRSLAIREKALGPDHPDVATVAEQSGVLYNTKAAMPTPSRSTSARWRSGKRRSVPIIPMSRRR